MGDNAPSVQRSFKLLSKDCPHILYSPCCAHTLNLIVSDIFENVDVAKSALKIVDELIRAQKMKRYSITRWNSRYDAIITAGTKKLFAEDQEPLYQQTKQIC